MIHHVEVQVLVLLLVAAFVGMGARRFRLPYTLALVVAGLALGFLDLGVLSDVELNADLLLLLLLPALLFEAAFHIDFTEFRRNLGTIFMLAVPGVLVAGGVTAVLLYFGLGSTGLVADFGWREALLFASVLAATDPVSVLALFRQLGVPKRLYLIVEGESLLNDGVAVVVFVIVTTVYGVGGAHGAETPDSLTAYSLQTFLRMGGGGILIGVALGGAFSVLTRQVDDHLIETTLTAVLAYGSFLIAEQLHCSGVLSTVFAGIVAGSYGARVGMSHSTRNAVVDFWEFAAFIANSFIFLLVGLELEPVELLHGGVAIVIAFIATVLARGTYVYAAIPLVGRLTTTPLPASWRHVLVWGGLRGSLSMVLILTLPTSFPGRGMLVTLVFGVVGLSLFVQGLSMAPLLRKLGLLVGENRHHEYDRARATLIMSRYALDELAELEGHGLIESGVAARLRRHYESQTSKAEAQARELVSNVDLSAQTAEALERLIAAERVGLRAAQHAELLDDVTAEALSVELAKRLALLDERPGGTEAELAEILGQALGPDSERAKPVE
ncbi:Na+/H+ antiporter [Enhygromyxa salina]|uniref:Na+/H+ antiporter n=1 Tax=Enhygromyxa salina TaxID=215803 RepID=A0A0C2CUD5_9BACT|nr:cation:proton antiporter [Enhygromyxa salina]KIG14741.1 Na+/H+ antiporter [Enhygromyxa salina]